MYVCMYVCIYIYGGGGVLPHKRLMRMCRWMGSHFYDWIDYNGVAFSIELLHRGRTFSGEKILLSRDSKWSRLKSSESIYLKLL